MAEIEQPSQNGVEMCTEDDEGSKSRPADIEQDMREMERRKRVEAIMGSKLFREELERIVDSQIREGGTSGILQQLSDIVGIPTSRVGNIFKSSNCVLPINDIRGVESMGYSKGEKILRCKLAATFRLLDVYGWTRGLGAQITARLKVDQELFLVNPYGLLYHEVTASSLNKVDMQGNVIEHGTTNFGINKNHFILHSVVHAARPDIRCAIYIGCNAVVAVSSLLIGLLPISNDAVVLGEISTHQYTGSLADTSEREKLVRNLGPMSKVMLLTNHGALCCGETIEEAFFAAYHIVQACETQLKLLPVGIDNLVLIPEESRKNIYDAARRAPEDVAAAFEKKATITATVNESAASDKDESQGENNKDTSQKLLHQPKWRVGGAEFEALMRMLDNAGFRTGYIYRHPLIKSELPKPKNDVEVPPAVSSLGYLLEEEELYRQGIWKKGDWRKGGDRSRWLNSPNVYQKVEVLETGTPDPKKITKWVAEGSPTHSTPVRIEGALQFVPPGTNPKEFKKVQQQIKDNRRADKISAGPQSHILEGVTWDEANRIKDATVSSAGDHVVLMGAASKGIIQRGFQHNATVYKAPYAKNPFDNVTDDELNEYKRTVEKKKSVHGEYTDTDFSESEPLSSLQTSGVPQHVPKTAVVSQSETEDASEHQVIRIETKQAPVPSQPEVVLSDAQENYSINPTNQCVVTEKLNQNFKIDDEEKNVDPFDGVCHQQHYHPILSDNFFTLHSYLKELLQQNVDLKGISSDSQCEILPFSLEITSSEFYPYKKCAPDFIDTQVCYPLVRSEVDSQTNDMAYNIKYSRTYSFPSSTSSHQIAENTCKPYRTVSHFGFNYPRFQAPPEHFHIPVLPNKYVPLKKSLSYNEIFSSPRYVDLCDNCFEKVLHLRPELVCGRLERKKLLDNDNSVSKDDNYDNYDENEELYEAVKDWIDNQQLNVSRVLEPVIEVDEEDQISADISFAECNSNLETGVEGSLTFVDKITRMNYSEESTNVGFQPSQTICSELSESHTATIDNLTNDINCLSPPKLPESINVIQLSAEQPFSDDRNADTVDVNSSYSGDSMRKLMTREERNQRKYEFTEIWEDHIEYFTKKQLSDSDNTSDNESDVERNASEIFFGESRVSNMSLTNDAEEQNCSTDSTSATFRVSSPSSSGQVLYSAPSLEFYSFGEKESNVSDSELNSLERIIIGKIDENNLTNQEQIFDDIRKSIRQKVTPSKLEKLVKEPYFEASTLVFSSTPDGGNVDVPISEGFLSMNTSELENNDDSSLAGVIQRKSRCEILSNDNSNRKRRFRCTPKSRNYSKYNQDQSPRTSMLSSSTDNSPPARHPHQFLVHKKIMKCPKHSASVDCIDCQKTHKRIKRNFVAENIRNAAKPRRRHNINMLLQSNSLETSASTPCLSTESKFSKSSSSPTVYSFQTTSMRGSPRFWVSLSPRDNLVERHVVDTKTKRKKLHKRDEEREVRFEYDGQIKQSIESKEMYSNSDVNIEASIKSKVEKEINSLGQQIDELKPRLDQYKKTIDEYGEQISKVSHFVDDAVQLQNEIEDSRQKLKEEVLLSQYVDEVCCEAQTFSISEADD